MSDQEKLDLLCDIENMDEMEMLERAISDGIAWGICTNPQCDYTTRVEPDSDIGWCEVCGTNTVKSCLILKGIM